MEYFKVKIEGRQFKKSYLVYIVEIYHIEKGHYFYIGQTGDRKHITARPAFRRLAAHFIDQGSSTENQVFRQIAVKILNIKSAEKRKKFSANIKEKVSKFLVDTEIIMHVFPINVFPDKISKQAHKVNRDYVETLETILIHKFIKKYGIENILNRNIRSYKNHFNDKLEILAENIIKKTCG